MKKKKFIKYLKLFFKYFIPIVLGWLEGDSHAIADAISNLLLVF